MQESQGVNQRNDSKDSAGEGGPHWQAQFDGTQERIHKLMDTGKADWISGRTKISSNKKRTKRKPRAKITLKCVYCKKKFKRSNSRVLNPDRSFCNKKCASDIRRYERKQREDNGTSTVRKKLTCEYCKKEFMGVRYRSIYKRGYKIYCGTTCSSKGSAGSRWSEGTSKYFGVHWYTRNSKWQAQIRHNHKVVHLGYYKKEKDAAKAYDNAAKKYHGKDAILNFGRKEEKE